MSVVVSVVVLIDWMDSSWVQSLCIHSIASSNADDAHHDLPSHFALRNSESVSDHNAAGSYLPLTIAALYDVPILDPP